MDDEVTTDEPTDAAPEPDPSGVQEPPTLLARVRALWCQLVSGLG